MSYKKFVFETTDVREYWFINLAKKTLAQYENVENEFILRHTLDENDTLKSIVLEGFDMAIKDILTT